MKSKKAIYVTHSAVIAVLYLLLTYLSALAGLSSGVIQIRFSEALAVLPLFTPAAVPGLFLGCMLSNLFSGAVLWDVIFGSLATLAGAAGTYALRKKSKWLAPLPPIAANTLIIPPLLAFAYGAEEGLWFIGITVFIGEFISCGILGMLLYHALNNSYCRKIFTIKN